ICRNAIVYGCCDGNASAAQREYIVRYPGRRVPSTQVFTRLRQRLVERGFVHKVRSELEAATLDLNTKEQILDRVRHDPEISNRDLTDDNGAAEKVLYLGLQDLLISTPWTFLYEDSLSLRLHHTSHYSTGDKCYQAPSTVTGSVHRHATEPFIRPLHSLTNDFSSWVRRLSQDNQIKQRRACLLLGQVTAERSCPCKRPACPAIGGGSEVTFKPLDSFRIIDNPSGAGTNFTGNRVVVVHGRLSPLSWRLYVCCRHLNLFVRCISES
ncbi:hypothetical protein J6590_060438, partial [Homalodisca vitripennis]